MPSRATLLLPSLMMTALATAPMLAAQQTSAAQQSAIGSTIARLFGLRLAPGLGVVVVRDTQILYMKGVELHVWSSVTTFRAEGTSASQGSAWAVSAGGVRIATSAARRDVIWLMARNPSGDRQV